MAGSLRLKDALPDFYEELKAGFLAGWSSDDLDAVDRASLCAQLDELVLVGRCGCNFSACGSFWVAHGEPTASTASEYSHTIDIRAPSGEVLVDVDRNNRIRGFEIVSRDLRSRLVELELLDVL